MGRPKKPYEDTVAYTYEPLYVQQRKSVKEIAFIANVPEFKVNQWRTKHNWAIK